MSRFERHIFVCTNRRAPDNPKGSCAGSGSEVLCARFKEELAKRGLKGRMRANASGCLDSCEQGPTVVVYPDAVWYARVQLADVEEIVERHVLRGEVVSRLLRKEPEARSVACATPASSASTK